MTNFRRDSSKWGTGSSGARSPACERIPLSDEARAACEVYGIDPYWTLAEGALIVTVIPEAAAAVRAALADRGIVAADAGEVMSGKGKLWLTEPDGTVRTLTEAEPDPYWEAYGRAVAEGWS